MATYPIKVLRDEDKKPFIPLVNAGAIVSNDGSTLEEKLENKLEASNIIEGFNINIEKNGNNCTISANLPSGLNIVNNLTTESPGLGVLDAYQGKILKDSIPKVVNNLTTISDKESLSAYQGYLLNLRSAPAGGKNGQVLKKSNDNDYQFEWGDAADPNAISGDGSITKIIQLTYEEYKKLEASNQIDVNTEYHINEGSINQNLSLVEDVLDSTSAVNALSANQGRVLLNKIENISLTPGPTGPRGTDVKTLKTETRHFHFKDWQTYGTLDREEKWVRVSNTDQFKRGDIGILNGVITDRNDVGIFLLGEVTDIGTDYIVLSSKNLIYGDKGQDAVVSSGDNTYGHWIQFTDGTMICTRKRSITFQCTNPWGSLYYGKDNTTWSFAQEFIEPPTVSITIKPASTTGCLQGYADACTITTNSIQGLYVIRPDSRENVATELNIVAIGKWK